MNINDTDKIAQVDLDGTIADLDKAQSDIMETLYAPNEPQFEKLKEWDSVPEYIKARKRLIRNQPGFWRNLPQIKEGFHIVNELRKIGFTIHVLTKGPDNTPNAWTEKYEWCKKNIPDALVTVTQNKSTSYGRLLVDDYPPYFLPWLEVRPRGFVISVAQPWNEDISHPRFFRYTGYNKSELSDLLQKIFDRKSGELISITY